MQMELSLRFMQQLCKSWKKHGIMWRINNLSDFVFSAIKAIGAILLGFGIVQIGLALKGHDASQRAQGFMTFFGGVVIYFAKDILDMIL